MSKTDRNNSPSPIIVYLIAELRKVLPADQRAGLDEFDIKATTAQGDFHRAFHCVEWAIGNASLETQKKHQHILERLKEAIQVLRDTEYGISFGVMMGDAPRAKEFLQRDPRYKVDSIDAIEDIEISWVDDAVLIAKDAADTAGWQAVPWQDLTRELIAIHTG